MPVRGSREPARQAVSRPFRVYGIRWNASDKTGRKGNAPAGAALAQRFGLAEEIRLSEERTRASMPRISEANLEEHRRSTMNALLDCAEQIVKTQGNDALTPAAVGEGAGIARNSIYRYVKNMDDLRRKLLQRHLPDWRKALEDGLVGVSDPVEVIAVWVRINLEQTSIHGHGWMMRLHATGNATAHASKPDPGPSLKSENAAATAATGHASPDNTDTANADTGGKPDFHASIAMPIIRAWRQLCPSSPRTGAALTRGLVSSGMRLLESARDDDQAHAVIFQIEQAARAVAQALREDGTAEKSASQTTPV